MDDETPDGEVTDKIVIGETELSLDEAKELVDSGKSFKELKAKYPDTNFDELPKAFTQSRQELAELKKPKKEPVQVAPNEEARLKQIDEFFDDPHVVSKVQKLIAEKEKTLKEDIEFGKVMDSLEAEFDGSDGKPKFDRIEVLKYGQANNTYNPRIAYLDMHKDELDEWKLKKSLEKKTPTTFFEKRGGTGGKLPDVKTPTTFREATNAALAEQE